MIIPGLPFGLSGKTPLKYVGGKTNRRNTAGSATWSVSLTGLSGGLSSAPEAGDFVVALVSSPYTNGRTVSTSAPGWTRILNSSTRNSYGLFVKRLTSAETGFTVSYSNSVTENASAIHVWRNTDLINPIDASAVGATAAPGAPNPPSITTVTPGAVVLASYVRGNGTGSLLTAPLGMENYVTSLFAGANETGMASIFRAIPGAYDPPTFDGFSGSWDAVTVAIRPR